MQHKLVILGSMDEFIALVKQAKARGIYTIVCDGYPDGPAKAFANKSYDIDIRDVDGVAAMCKSEGRTALSPPSRTSCSNTTSKLRTGRGYPAT